MFLIVLTATLIVGAGLLIGLVARSQGYPFWLGALQGGFAPVPIFVPLTIVVLHTSVYQNPFRHYDYSVVERQAVQPKQDGSLYTAHQHGSTTQEYELTLRADRGTVSMTIPAQDFTIVRRSTNKAQLHTLRAISARTIAASLFGQAHDDDQPDAYRLVLPERASP